MKKKLLLPTLFGANMLTVTFAHAAKITIESQPVLNDPSHTDILVKLQTEGKTINSIDGTLQVAGFSNLVTSIHTGGSDFTLWPEKPSLKGDIISFVGGVPGGIDQDNALLFTIRVQSALPESSYISYGKITAYENSSQGYPTAIEINENPIELKNSIHTSSTASTGKDTTPPQSFSVLLGSDPSLFEGKYFISFSTSDTGSGVNHYEIQEGSGPFIRSSSPYVLQDQTHKKMITVKAIDNAGNIRVETLSNYESLFYWTKLVLIALILMLAIRTIFRTLRKPHYN